MKIDIDDVTKGALSAVQDRIQVACGIKPKGTSVLVQVLLQWACAALPDSELKGLAPKTLSLAQRRKTLLTELRAFAGKADDLKLDKLMKTINRLKQPDEIKSEKPTQDSV
jgi:hypothetical protein